LDRIAPQACCSRLSCSRTTGNDAEKDFQHQVPDREDDHDRNERGEHKNDGVLEFLVGAQNFPSLALGREPLLHGHRDLFL